MANPATSGPLRETLRGVVREFKTLTNRVRVLEVDGAFVDAVVDRVAGNRVTIKLPDTTTVVVPYLASYTPTVGDTVKVARGAGGWFVLGRLA